MIVVLEDILVQKHGWKLTKQACIVRYAISFGNITNKDLRTIYSYEKFK
jgi:hypothetical protein